MDNNYAYLLIDKTTKTAGAQALKPRWTKRGLRQQSCMGAAASFCRVLAYARGGADVANPRGACARPQPWWILLTLTPYCGQAPAAGSFSSAGHLPVLFALLAGLVPPCRRHKSCHHRFERAVPRRPWSRRDAR